MITRRTSAQASTANRPPVKERWEGIKSHQPQVPQPSAGQYRLRVRGFRVSRNGNTSIVDLEIVEIFQGGEGMSVGNATTFIQFVANDAGPTRVRAAVAAMAGFDSDEAYDEWDPHARFMRAMVLGEQNEYTERGDTVVGRLVDAEVRLGRADDKGDFFRDWSWAPVPEEEQDDAQ